MKIQAANNSRFTASTRNQSATFPHFPQQLFQTYPTFLKPPPQLPCNLAQQRTLLSISWKSPSQSRLHLSSTYITAAIEPASFTLLTMSGGRTPPPKANPSTRAPVQNPWCLLRNLSSSYALSVSLSFKSIKSRDSLLLPLHYKPS